MRPIDADALTAKWQNVLDKKSNEKDTVAYLTFELFIDRLKGEPTIDPESLRPQGEWINWGKSGTPTYENYGTCSVCHEDAEIHTEHRNYCPNCGAKMRIRR